MEKNNRSITFYDNVKMGGFKSGDWLQIIWYKLCKNYCQSESSIHNLWTSNHYIATHHKIHHSLNKATHNNLYSLTELMVGKI
jgi:hypothetical protein